VSSFDLDSEYFSPEEVDGIKRKLEKEYHGVSDLNKAQVGSNLKPNWTTIGSRFSSNTIRAFSICQL